MNNSEQPVVVTQADRDAAYRMFDPNHTNRGAYIGEIRDGKRDSDHVVQAFARHRLSHRDIPPGHVIVPVELSQALTSIVAIADVRDRDATSAGFKVGRGSVHVPYALFEAAREALNAIPKQGEV